MILKIKGVVIGRVSECRFTRDGFVLLNVQFVRFAEHYQVGIYTRRGFFELRLHKKFPFAITRNGMIYSQLPKGRIHFEVTGVATGKIMGLPVAVVEEKIVRVVDKLKREHDEDEKEQNNDNDDS